MSVDDSRPIWIQLVETFSHNIVTDEWTAGSKIPSVRELAFTYGVNPNTVQRALSQLDATGLTITERAQGRFVTTDKTLIDNTRHELASQATHAHIHAVTSLGLNLDETLALICDQWSASSS